MTNENLDLIRDHTYFNNPEKLKNIKPLFPKTGVKYTNNTSNGTVGNHAAPYPRVRIFYDGTFVPNYPVDFKPPIAGGPLTNFEPNSNSIKPNAEPTVGCCNIKFAIDNCLLYVIICLIFVFFIKSLYTLVVI